MRCAGERTAAGVDATSAAAASSNAAGCCAAADAACKALVGRTQVGSSNQGLQAARKSSAAAAAAAASEAASPHVCRLQLPPETRPRRSRIVQTKGKSLGFRV